MEDHMVDVLSTIWLIRVVTWCANIFAPNNTHDAFVRLLIWPDPPTRFLRRGYPAHKPVQGLGVLHGSPIEGLFREMEERAASVDHPCEDGVGHGFKITFGCLFEARRCYRPANIDVHSGTPALN